MDENVTKLEFKVGNSKEYEFKLNYDGAVYVKELESGHIPGCYYLILWKSYFKKESTCEQSLAIQHFKKMISLFHKDYSNKLIATSSPIDTVSLIVRPTAKFIDKVSIKKKRGRLTKIDKANK